MQFLLQLIIIRRFLNGLFMALNWDAQMGQRPHKSLNWPFKMDLPHPFISRSLALSILSFFSQTLSILSSYRLGFKVGFCCSIDLHPAICYPFFVHRGENYSNLKTLASKPPLMLSIVSSS